LWAFAHKRNYLRPNLPLTLIHPPSALTPHGEGTQMPSLCSPLTQEFILTAVGGNSSVAGRGVALILSSSVPPPLLQNVILNAVLRCPNCTSDVVVGPFTLVSNINGTQTWNASIGPSFLRQVSG
jgi:hypothetical protein